MVPTKSLHARWFAQDGSEPGSGAGSWGGSVITGGGSVGFKAGRGGFVILWSVRKSNTIFEFQKHALCRQFDSKLKLIHSNSDNTFIRAEPQTAIYSKTYYAHNGDGVTFIPSLLWL